MGIQIKQSRQYEVVPTGEYVAKIVSVEQVEGRFPNERTGKIEDQLRWEFEIQAANGGEPKKISAWTSMSFGPKSKLYGLAQAAFGKAIPPEYVLDTEHLLNRRVKLVVLVRTKEDGTEFSKVDSFKPVNGAVIQPPAPVAPPVPKPVGDDGALIPF